MNNSRPTAYSIMFKRKPLKSRYIRQFETQLRGSIAPTTAETAELGSVVGRETTVRLPEVENTVGDTVSRALGSESEGIKSKSSHNVGYESFDKDDFEQYRARVDELSRTASHEKQSYNLSETDSTLRSLSLNENEASVPGSSSALVPSGIETRVMVSNSEPEGGDDSTNPEAIQENTSDTKSIASDESDLELELELWEHHRREAATHYLKKRWYDFEPSIKLSLLRYTRIPPRNVEFDRFTWTMRLAEAQFHQKKWPAMIETLQSLAEKSEAEGGPTSNIYAALVQMWIAHAFMRIGTADELQEARIACKKAIKIGGKEQKSQRSNDKPDASELSQKRLVNRIAYGSILQMITLLELLGELAEARAYKSLIPTNIDATEAVGATRPSYNTDYSKQAVPPSRFEYPWNESYESPIEPPAQYVTTPVTDLMKHSRLGLRDNRTIVEIDENGNIQSPLETDKADLSEESLASTLSKIKSTVKEAIERGDFQTIKDLYKDPRVVRAPMIFKDRGHIKSTPLHIAIGSSQFAIARHMLDRGFSPNAVDESGANALIAVMYTTLLDQFDYLELLIFYGVAVNHLQRNGGTILHLIAGTGDVNSAELLISHGARVEIKDGDDRSPLFEAVQRNRIEMTRLLVQNGADPFAKNWLTHETALDYAKDKKLKEIVKILKGAQQAGRLSDIFYGRKVR